MFESSQFLKRSGVCQPSPGFSDLKKKGGGGRRGKKKVLCMYSTQIQLWQGIKTVHGILVDLYL